MNQLFVKICGITRPQDAELAAGLGASALGFVFWPDSPRCVSVETAKAIAASVPAGVAEGRRVRRPACRRRHANHGRGRTGCRAAARPREPGILPATDGPPRVGRPKFSRPFGYGSRTTASVKHRRLRLRTSCCSSTRTIPCVFGGTGKTVNWDAAREIAATRPDDSCWRLERGQHQAGGSIGAAVWRRRVIGRRIGAGREGSEPVANVFRGPA